MTVPFGATTSDARRFACTGTTGEKSTAHTVNNRLDTTMLYPHSAFRGGECGMTGKAQSQPIKRPKNRRCSASLPSLEL